MSLPRGEYTTIINFVIDHEGRHIPLSSFTKPKSTPKKIIKKPSTLKLGENIGVVEK